MSAARTITLTVNAETRSVAVDPETQLLYALRNDLGLVAAKYGCGAEQCGACAVLADGEKAFSCTMTVAQAVGKAIITLEGIGTAETPHALQKAFEAEQAVQCGYCISGMIVSATALLQTTYAPSEGQIREALARNLCRCGTHTRIIKAVQRAARELSGEPA